MPRKRPDEGYIQQKISIPATLMARFQRLHWDPVLGKTRYGAISDVMTGLLTTYVNTIESGGHPEQLYRKTGPDQYIPIIEGTTNHA